MVGVKDQVCYFTFGLSHVTAAGRSKTGGFRTGIRALRPSDAVRTQGRTDGIRKYVRKTLISAVSE